MRTKSNDLKKGCLFTFILLLALDSFSQTPIPKLRNPENTFISDNAMHLDPDGGVIYFCNCILKKENCLQPIKKKQVSEILMK
jgi:hypothetical protein